jgi:glyoxylase-like metal-dependent hydrolase (beta-lactamase superfamily II)
MVVDDTLEPLDNGIQETYTFDVGQADTRLTITKDGKLILCDADIDNVGTKLDEVLAGRTGPQMAEGRTTIDLFLCTHHHYDHVDGLDSLHDNYEVHDVIQPHDSRFEITDPETKKSEKGVRKPVISKFRDDLEKLMWIIFIMHQREVNIRSAKTRTSAS